MSLQVSCPVFRCPKNSISRCEGYGRACERYYCRTHTAGRLCDRCVSIKQEEMKSGYKQMMKDLGRQAFSAAMTGGLAALFVISLLLIAAGVVLGFMQRSKQGLLPLFVITLGAGALGFIVALIWYNAKTREYMRSESLELDQKYPGFYDFYQKWQKVVDDATSYSDI
jgi:hypothetical protein